MGTFIVTGFLLATTLFFLFLLLVALYFPRKKVQKLDNFPDVSIVIPFRNEAEHLTSLLSSLEQQRYPANMEIILVNDYSDDNSITIINSFITHSSLSIHLLDLIYNAKRNLTSKQQAIDLGIREATYEIIALTDADMLFKNNWLQSLCEMLIPEIDLVYGHSAIRPESSLFSLLQSFQLEFLFTIASVFHYSGIVGSCMGNNVALRKKWYIASGGYDTIGYSITEDRALLQHLWKAKRKSAIVTPFIPTAYTYPNYSFRSFLHQVQRWAYGGFKSGLHLLLFALWYALFNIILLGAFSGNLSGVNLSLGFGNFCILWIFLIVAFKKNGSPVSALFFPVYYLFVLVETVILPISILCKKEIVWKNRPI